MGTTIVEVKYKSTGFVGAPGWTSFYFEGTSAEQRHDAVIAAEAFMASMKGFFPTVWRVKLEPELRVLDDVTGELLDSWVVDNSVTTLNGSSGSANYGSGASGMCVAWRTATVNKSRKVRGRTFFVPLETGQYDGDGSINGGSLGTALAAANELISDSGSVYGIWSRPVSGAGGKFAPATGASITDQAAVLRSRRS